MSLQKLSDGWMKFGNGIKWRCRGPNFFCEVINDGHFPVSGDKRLQTRIKEIRNFYAARLSNLGTLNSFGYGIDALVANAFTESSGSVPSPLNTADLEKLFDSIPGHDVAGKLDHIARYVRGNKPTKGLVAFEPGYQNPISTPKRISMGSQHQLVSTAAWLLKLSDPVSSEKIKEIVLRLPTDSRYAAELAVVYFNKMQHQHSNQPPLMAACYNAGSVRESNLNVWNLKCTGDHIDRWIMYFNMSRSCIVSKNTTRLTITDSGSAESKRISPTILPQASLKNYNVSKTISIERVLTALQRKRFLIREADDKNYNLNLVGIRNSNARVNYFDDILFVFWKYKGQWFTKEYNITTFPGLAYLNEKIINKRGTAILAEGQYKNSHQIGFHNRNKPTRYEALVQSGNLTVYRDNNKNGRIELDRKTLQTGSEFAVNIHRAKGAGLSLNVGPYSAGCQVFASFEQWTEFNKLFRLRNEQWGKTFTYTLINKTDL